MPASRDHWLEAALATAIGMGGFICVFQALAIGGVLVAPAVLASLAAGFGLALWQGRAVWRHRSHSVAGESWLASMGNWTLPERTATWALALVALPTLVAPLSPPWAYDELMYHLPYARLVAQEGRLGIHEWLRYPWFPFNFNLLYAGALTLLDDVFPHLIHALAGWLSVVIVFRLTLAHAGRIAACIAAAIWLALSDYGSAYIDMGVALFVLCAVAALWLWDGQRLRDDKSHTPWLVMAAWFLGLAAGSKYQALIFLLPVAWFVIRRERRMLPWALSLGAFLLPCAYWFTRNAVQTGDPFNPIGGPLFGFTNWNAADYKQQVLDVKNHANYLSLAFWPLLLAPFHPAARQSSPVRALLWLCAFALLVWAVTSRYPRYLLPSFPLLAMGATLGWLWLGERLAGGWSAWRARGKSPVSGSRPTHAGARSWAMVLVVAVLATVSLAQTARGVRDISPDAASRAAFLNARVPGYDAWVWLAAHPTPGRIYKVELNQSVYYAPKPVYGDVFGPWRYANFFSDGTAAAAQKLRAQGFDTLVLPTAIAPLNTLPDFARHFSKVFAGKDGVEVYRIEEHAAP